MTRRCRLRAGLQRKMRESVDDSMDGVLSSRHEASPKILDSWC